MKAIDRLIELLVARGVRRRLGPGSEETVRRDASGRLLERVTRYGPDADGTAAVQLVEEFDAGGWVARSVMYFGDGQRAEVRYARDGWPTHEVKFDADGKVVRDYTFAYEDGNVTVTKYGPDRSVIEKTTHPRRLL